MALGVDRAVAELLRDGDPVRAIDGLDTLRGFRLYDDADTAKRNIYVGEEPPEGDDVVTVIIEGGAPPISGSAPVGRRPGFTVRSRSLSYETAMEIAHEVHKILDYFEGVVHAVPFFRILANFEPIPLGRDRDEAGGRWTMSQTFSATTENFALS